MKRFVNYKILLGVTGGVAAYKSADFVRMLQREGAEQVVAAMTPSAEGFIAPLTLETLTRHAVYYNSLENNAQGIPQHIALAQELDAMVIMPASANTIAKLAHGMADNMVTTTALTFTHKPLVIVPAMNTRMWNNPMVQKNLRLLNSLDWVTIVPPTVGDLACGEYGDGKMADLDTVLLYLYGALHPQRRIYRNKRVIVTAGGTSEAIDSVRCITNHSSGKMGTAIADELFAMGADVLLLHTMDEMHKPYRTIQMNSAQDMAVYTKRNFKEADGLIMAAAVSDFRVATDQRKNLPGKIKKTAKFTLDLEKTEDILGAIGPTKEDDQFVVGFAAEADNVMAHAREKLERKDLDMIVVNDISDPEIGFGSDLNEVTLLFKDKTRVDLPRAEKFYIARQLLFHLYQKYLARREGQHDEETSDTPTESSEKSE